MRAAASDEMLALTDIADLLVGNGVPFREAHGIVAGLVRKAIEERRSCRAQRRASSAWSLLASTSTSITRPASGHLVESKVSEGGTALARLREQLEYARRRTRQPVRA